MSYDDIVKKLLADMGFEPRVVCHIDTEKTETGSVVLHVFVDTTMFADVPFLANGKIVALLQALVKKLPTKFADGTLVEWRFEPILKTDPIEELTKESSVKVASTLDAADIKILDSAVGRLGVGILKSPAAIDTLVGLHVAQHIINKIKESASHKVPAAGSEGFWRNPNDWN
jgi:hypothetical protein